MNRILIQEKLVKAFIDQLFRSIHDLSGKDQLTILDCVLLLIKEHKKGPRADYSLILDIIDNQLLSPFKTKVKQLLDSDTLQYLEYHSTSQIGLFNDVLGRGVSDDEMFNIEEHKRLLYIIETQILFRKRFLIYASDENQQEPEIRTTHPEHTTRRQVLSIYYLNKSYHFNKGTEISLSRFIQFLTDKNLDNIIKCLRNASENDEERNSRSDKYLIQDMKYIKEYFRDMGMNDIVQYIERDIRRLT